MSREILFKAKRKDWKHLPKDNWWVEGDKISDEVTGQVFIHMSGNSVNESDKIGEEGCLSFFTHEVDPETICQYTGYIGKSGTRVWENDIVRNKGRWGEWVGKVVFRNSSFKINWIQYNKYSNNGMSVFTENISNAEEVIGNIFDNPEMLEKKR